MYITLIVTLYLKNNLHNINDILCLKNINGMLYFKFVYIYY